MKIFDKIFKKRVNMVDLLTNQCKYLVNGVVALRKFCTSNDEEDARKVKMIERKGDVARKAIIDELNRNLITSIDKASLFNLSSITPIERKDLFELSRLLDEFLDYVNTTVNEIIIYEIKADKAIKKMVDVLLIMGNHIAAAINSINKNKELSRDEAVEAKKIENKIGELSAEAIANLLKNKDLDIREVLKYREIYRHINQTADIGDEAMDALLNILVTI